jgi:hypothetical protein
MLGIAGTALGLIAVAWALISLRASRGLRERLSIAESDLAVLRAELGRQADLQAGRGANTERRIKRAELEAADIAARVGQLEFRAAPQSIDQAIDYARYGADPDQLRRQFGISRGEADLLARLHGRKQPA